MKICNELFEKRSIKSQGGKVTKGQRGRRDYVKKKERKETEDRRQREV